jgi:hypothetical protein
MTVRNGVSEVQQSHTEAAKARGAELDAMRLAIPNFVFPTTKGGTRQLTNAASLPPQFIELTAWAVTKKPILVRNGAVDPEETRGLMSYGEAYGPLADDLEELAQFIRHSIAAAKHRAGTEALTTYALAQRLAKRPESADLAALVEDMRRALGGRGKRKAAPVTPDPVQPDPAKTSPPVKPPADDGIKK